MLKSNLYVVLILLLRLSCFFEVSSALAALTATEVTCIDRDSDILTSPNFIYATDISKETCESEEDCVPNSPLVGGDGDEDLTHRGFVVVRGMANLGHQIKWFRPSPDTTSEYLYLRYYVHKVPRTPSMFRVNGALGSAAALLDVTSDGKWKEGCFPIRHDSFDYRSIVVYSGVPEGEEYLALDKIILVAPTDGTFIACSSTEVEEIKEFCHQDFFPPTTTTTTTTTSTTTSSTTTTTERTSPGTSTTPSSSTSITTEKGTSPSEVPPPTNPGTSSTPPSTRPTESDQGTTTTTKPTSKNTTTKIAIYVASAIGLLVFALILSIGYSKYKSPAGSKVNSDVIEAAGPDMAKKQEKETQFTDSHFPANNGRNYFSNNFKTRQPKFDSQQV